MEKLMQKTAKNRFSPNYKTESEALNRTYIYWQQNDHMERGDIGRVRIGDRQEIEVFARTVF